MDIDYHNKLSEILNETVDLLSKIIGEESPFTDRVEFLRDSMGNFEYYFEDNNAMHSDGEIFDPVCRKCGNPLTTEELICCNCRR